MQSPHVATDNSATQSLNTSSLPTETAGNSRLGIKLEWVIITGLFLFLSAGLVWISRLQKQLNREIEGSRKIQKKLQDRENFIYAVLDNLPIGIAVNSVTPRAQFEYMNDLFPKIYRTTREALHDSDTFWEAVYEDPEFREEIKLRVVKDCASGDRQRMHWEEVPISRQQDGTRYVTAQNIPVPDKSLVISSAWDVTEQKRAAQEREHSISNILQERDKLHTLLDAMTDEVWFCDAERLQIEPANTAAVQGLGFESRDDICQPISELLAKLEITTPEGRVRPEQDAPLLRSLKGEVLDNVGEVVYHPITGERLFRQVSSAPLRDKNGRITGAVAVVRDISKQVKAERELRESEILLRSLFEHHSAIEFIVDPSTGRIVDANQAAARFYGWSLNQLKTMRIQDINTLPEEEVAAELQKAKNQERVYFEFRHRRADGSLRDVEVYSNSITVKGKSLLHSIIHDVSKRKRIEKERERLLLAIEETGEGVVITDPEGNIQYVNPAFSRVTGYTREEIIGQTPSLLNSGKQNEDFYRKMWKTISSGATWQGRIVNKCKDGSFITEEMSISPVHDAAGNIVNFVAVKRDITEKLHLERQFLQAQKMEAIGRLAGGISHDFNNMLSVILGYAELALDSIEPDSENRESIEEILDAARKSADLVRQLLAFARKQTIAPISLNLNQTIPSLIKMLERLIGENIQLIWMPGPNLWDVLMDPAQLDQILANLAVNARDAISDVGKITIETENAILDRAYCDGHPGFKPGEYVLLAITDDGHGMSQETQNHIFEPFFTTKELGKGTGLGLATIYGIVKQNHGFINVYSEPGIGSTFKIYIPRHTNHQPDEPSKHDQQRIRTGSETILIVEDKPAVLKICCNILESLGYTVLSANTPEEALHLARQYPETIHLLLTDVVMPGMNGRHLRDRIQSIRPEIKCLFMSGYPANTVALDGVLEQDIHFIEKPFPKAKLAVKIREALEN